MVRPKCQCPYWLHEACLAKAMFEAGGCPSCRTPTDEPDEASLLGDAADSGDTSKATRLLRSGISPSLRFLDNSTPLIPSFCSFAHPRTPPKSTESMNSLYFAHPYASTSKFTRSHGVTNTISYYGIQ
ncbi:hypothetical protein K469DRAFT_264685 [Zopfia rhizophila CBS 207.26]|uniref:Uncharacterized protein n=1 Tax=Zopfia rhizophila CBS 207.26 TaxID=1314779 RepID=A0A6A6DTT1_9PEZI|nr:hypothetical protein K469DRAFT_264685 [Zopfia rhizophila CBS 207.26]